MSCTTSGTIPSGRVALTQIYRNGSDWLAKRASTNLKGTTSIPAFHDLNSRTSSITSTHISHGVPAVSSQSHPGTAQPRCPQCSRPIEERICDACREKWREDGIDNSDQRTHGKNGPPRAIFKLLTAFRLLRSTRHGRRRRLLECGLMLDLERRRTGPMAQLTSWNILPSRYSSIGSYGVELGIDDGFREPATEHNSNWSSK